MFFDRFYSNLAKWCDLIILTCTPKFIFTSFAVSVILTITAFFALLVAEVVQKKLDIRKFYSAKSKPNTKMVRYCKPFLIIRCRFRHAAVQKLKNRPTFSGMEPRSIDLISLNLKKNCSAFIVPNTLQISSFQL